MSDRTQIRFFRGTLGMGILISITYGSDRIILDFGAPFDPASEIYDGYVRKRNVNRVKDALLLEKIPMVPGVFSRKELQDIELEPYEDSRLNTAVFINHLHLDHMSEMDKIDPRVPVWIHHDGLALQQALEEIGECRHIREYSSYEYGQIISVGQIFVQAYYSDHPCPGSSGYLIRTPDATVYYSGDIRFHGMHAERAWLEAEDLTKENVDLLIVDATTASPSESDLTDEMRKIYYEPGRDFLAGMTRVSDIYDDIFRNAYATDSLVVVNPYNRDVDMLQELYELAESTHRKLVLEPSYAHILLSLKGIHSAVLSTAECPSAPYMSDQYESVTLKEIRENPERYILQNSYPCILNLIDLEGVSAEYVHLFGEPIVPADKNYRIMRNMIDKLGWNFHTYSNLYSFSHAYPNHLAEFIRTVNPKCVVAVHSKHPELINPVNSIQYFPDSEKEYTLKDGKLIPVE